MNAESKRLLIVTYHFPPSAASGVFRVLGFVQNMPKFGWECSVVAPPTTPWEPTDPALVKAIPAGTDLQSARYPAGRLWKPVQRLLKGYPSWLPGGLNGCLRSIRRNRPTAVLTSGPPHCVHLLGLAVKRLYGLPWVADFRDPWVGNSKRGSALDWSRFAERLVFRNADLIVANAPRAAEAFVASHPKFRAKIVAVTNGYDAVESAPQPPRLGPLQILHTGELYAGRDPRPYLDAVQSLGANAEAPEFQTTFIGRLSEAASTGYDFAAEIRQRNLDGGVLIRGQVSYGEAREAMLRAGVLLLLDSPGRREGVPAKLYEYFGAERPILALAEPDGDVAAVLRQSGVLHRISSPGDVPGIRRSLSELTAVVRTGAPTVAEPAALRSFTRESLARDLVGHLDGLSVRRKV